jgi:hypothetical protein
MFIEDNIEFFKFVRLGDADIAPEQKDGSSPLYQSMIAPRETHLGRRIFVDDSVNQSRFDFDFKHKVGREFTYDPADEYFRAAAIRYRNYLKAQIARADRALDDSLKRYVREQFVPIDIVLAYYCTNNLHDAIRLLGAPNPAETIERRPEALERLRATLSSQEIQVRGRRGEAPSASIDHREWFDPVDKDQIALTVNDILEVRACSISRQKQFNEIELQSTAIPELRPEQGSGAYVRARDIAHEFAQERIAAGEKVKKADLQDRIDRRMGECNAKAFEAVWKDLSARYPEGILRGRPKKSSS